MLFLILVGTLGLVFGSFANVLIARIPLGQSIVKPGSRCPHCENPVRWFDNIPLVSYLVLKGKCRSCARWISPRYPLVEFLMGFLFVAAALHWGQGLEVFLRILPFLFVLVVLIFIDIDHRIIPDVFSIGGMVWGLLTSPLDTHLTWFGSLAGAGLGFGIFYGFSYLYYRVTGRVGLGGGDVKLLGMIGSFLGPTGVFATILISSITGSVWGIGSSLLQGKKNLMKTAIPYGPFLVVGAIFFLFLGDRLWPLFSIPM